MLSHISNLKKEMQEKYGVLPKGIVEDIYKNAADRGTNQQNGYRKKKGFEKLISEFGEFYFLRYRNLLNENIEKQIATRSIYLCTFANYDGILVYGNAKGENKFVRRKDLPEILGLKKTELANTMNKMFKTYELFFEKEDERIEMNREYFLKGKVDDKEDLKGAIRVFNEAVRELYMKSSPKEHKKLFLLFKLLPHINFTHNVVCSNPEEKNIELVDPLTLKEAMGLVKYSHITKFKKELLDMTVNGELVAKITETKYGKFIYVNPRIFYSGNKYEDLKACANEFRVKKQ